MTSLWWQLRRPNYEHFQQRGGKSIALHKRINKFLRLLALVFAVVAVRKYGIDEIRNQLIIFAATRAQQVRKLLSR